MFVLLLIDWLTDWLLIWLIDQQIDWLIFVDWLIVVGGVTRRAHPSLPSQFRGLSYRTIDPLRYRYWIDREEGLHWHFLTPVISSAILEILFCFLVLLWCRQVAKADVVGRRLKGRERNPPPWAGLLLSFVAESSASGPQSGKAHTTPTLPHLYIYQGFGSALI